MIALLGCLVMMSAGELTSHTYVIKDVFLFRKSDQMRQVVLVAVGEAAVKLLILGLCLTLLSVVICRRKATKLSVHMNCENPYQGSPAGLQGAQPC
ncbi:myeloid cell surface antigen CD33 isoform X4 [Rattus norvegicus]|uniref:myeloid cell surface antigen CD33 isoform X4 n=1 Tax=Rattus norvegicus TaxID=10116 RepID=UPI0019171B57|nr:myeloid cell surface antigen CD33 isoform X3 [Rattus norvegicus]